MSTALCHFELFFLWIVKPLLKPDRLLVRLYFFQLYKIQLFQLYCSTFCSFSKMTSESIKNLQCHNYMSQSFNSLWFEFSACRYLNQIMDIKLFSIWIMAHQYFLINVTNASSLTEVYCLCHRKYESEILQVTKMSIMLQAR